MKAASHAELARTVPGPRHRRAAWGALLAAFIGGCAHPDPLVARPLARERTDSLAQETRAVALPHCGSCHQSSLPTAQPAALAMFDLDQEGWAQPMAAGQLEVFLARLNGNLTDVTRPRVRAYLEAELALRSGPASNAAPK